MTGRDAEREQLAAALRERRDNPTATGEREHDYRPGAPCMDCGDYPGPRHDDSDCPRAVAHALLPVLDRIANERAAAELRNVAAGIVDGALLSDLPGAARQALAIAARVVRDRAAALRASNGAGTPT